MKLGIMSDTHDMLGNVTRILQEFTAANVDAVFHCGDFCSPFVAKQFPAMKEGTPFYAVRGNNDGDIIHLNATFAKIGQIKEGYQKVELGGRKILMLHGHQIPEEQITDIAAGGKFSIIMYGHYHHVRNEMVGNTLVVNPGEACGYLTGKATAMIVELVPGGAKASLIEL
nr:metallophosphoesterase [Candidatus Sigynarchaeota archaeon]